MPAKDKSSADKGPGGLITLLLKAADGDTAYRDLYLQRASAELAEAMPEHEYRTLSTEQTRVDALMRQTQAEVRNQNWERVKELSDQVERLRRALAQKADLLALAAAVYDAESVRIDPFSSGLASFVLGPGETLASVRDGLVAVLRDLAKADPKGKDLYGERRSYFEQKVLPSTETTPETKAKAPAKTDLNELRMQARLAAERGDSASLGRLADQITKAMAAAKEDAAKSPGAEKRGTVSAAAMGAVPTEPFPDASVKRAAKLGLEHVQTTARFAEITGVLADFLAQHAWQPGVSAQDVAQEGTVHLRDRLGAIELPADLKGPLAEMAALFALHPFINSCGVRYLGADTGEYVLVETFPEDQEPDAKSGIPPLLGLERRRGLARIEIEDALRRRGAALLEEQLGLDPREFRLVCIPFDVYARVGGERGWGNQPQWTHVDGYAVGRGGQLGSLAAGHSRYGGLQDLVILGRTDQRDTVTARFCVVRRARFLATA